MAGFGAGQRCYSEHKRGAPSSAGHMRRGAHSEKLALRHAPEQVPTRSACVSRCLQRGALQGCAPPTRGAWFKLLRGARRLPRPPVPSGFALQFGAKTFFLRPVRERDGLMAAGDGSRRQQGAGLDPACVRVGMTTRLTAVQTLSPADDATQHCVPMQPPGFLARSADFMRALRRLSSSTGRSGCWWGSSTLLLSLSPNTRV